MRLLLAEGDVPLSRAVNDRFRVGIRDEPEQFLVVRPVVAAQDYVLDVLAVEFRLYMLRCLSTP